MNCFPSEAEFVQTNPHLNPEFDEWAKTPVITVSLSSKGIAYLDAFEREEQWRKEQIEPIKEIAESANEQAEAAKEQAVSAKDQADTAKEQADFAREGARKANIQSRISLIISIFVAVINFIANFDKIKDFFCGFFQ